jgi:hypothetical protein
MSVSDRVLDENDVAEVLGWPDALAVRTTKPSSGTRILERHNRIFEPIGLFELLRHGRILKSVKLNRFRRSVTRRQLFALFDC